MELSKNLLKELIKYKVEPSKFMNGNKSHVLLSTKKVIIDVCTKIEPKILIVNKKIEEKIPILPPQKLYYTEGKILQKLADFETDFIAIVETTVPSDFEKKKLNSLVVFDQIADPGNLGTLIRSSHAFNYEGGFLTTNTVHPFNSKVIRSSSGSSFFFPMSSGSHDSLSELIQKNNLACFIASASSDSDISIQNTNLIDNIIKKHSGHCLVLGNESRGTNKKQFSIPKKNLITIHIPTQNVESLNVAVAGSIIMSHLLKLHK